MKCDVAKIRCLIATTGKDEADFLHSVGLGAKTLSRWENGTETPREDFVGFIARKLGVNISEFASCGENESAQAIQKPQTSWQNKKKRTASNNTDDTKTNNPPIITDAKCKKSNSTREKRNAKEALALPSNVCEEPASTILTAKLCLSLYTEA